MKYDYYGFIYEWTSIFFKIRGTSGRIISHHISGGGNGSLIVGDGGI